MRKIFRRFDHLLSKSCYPKVLQNFYEIMYYQVCSTLYVYGIIYYFLNKNVAGNLYVCIIQNHFWLCLCVYYFSTRLVQKNLNKISSFLLHSCKKKITFYSTYRHENIDLHHLNIFHQGKVHHKSIFLIISVQRIDCFLAVIEVT